MKKIFLLLTIIFFMSCPVFADTTSVVQTLGTFKKGECISLFQSGEGFASCNITSVNNPLSEVFIEDVLMTKRGTEYNYTFCNTNEIGKYIVNGFCTNTTEIVVWAYGFKVTYDGKSDDPILLSSRFFIWLLILIILTGAGFYCNGELEKGGAEGFGILVWLGLFITGLSGLIIIEDFLTLILGGGSCLLSVLMLFNIISGQYDSPRSWS